MPYIHTQTALPLSDETQKALTLDLGQAVQALGKSESWLMLRFEDNCRMAFGGKADPQACFIGISLYGRPAASQLEDMTERVTACVTKRTGIPPEKIYIRYLPTDAWGWNGGNF